ncbi:MAG: hypothetical protein L0922_05660 [Candidatus Mariimomonas ferrooxydans]
MKNLGGEFEELKEFPILSAVCSHEGRKSLESYMEGLGFRFKHDWQPDINNGRGVPQHDHYIANFYEYPGEYEDKSFNEKEDLLMNTRLTLRKMGESSGEIYAFSFYPDTITLKEVGDPMQLAEFFGLDKDPIKAKIIFAQGRQNSNYQIYLYACHPFFIQGTVP